MKKCSFFRLISFLAAFLLVQAGNAQTSDGNNIVLHKANVKKFASNLPASTHFEEATENLSAINKRMARDFSRSFQKANDIQIHTDASQATYISCLVDGISNRISYDKKGNFVSNLRYYREDGLPKEVRHQVKSTYYDCSIFGVVEVNYNQKTAYVITLEDKISWKKVKWVDGEIEVMEAFVKN